MTKKIYELLRPLPTHTELPPHIWFESNLVIFEAQESLNTVLSNPEIFYYGICCKHYYTLFHVLDTNNVICSVNSILRFLVLWLGPWPVTQVSPVQIPPSH